jgi:hypothetical protein
MKTLIAIQEEYIATCMNGWLRWQHRPDGGHFARIRRGAYRKARKQLERLGFTEQQLKLIVKDAHDMFRLELVAD